MNEIHKILHSKEQYETQYDEKIITFLQANPKTKDRIEIISKYLSHLNTRQRFDNDVYRGARKELKNV